MKADIVYQYKSLINRHLRARIAEYTQLSRNSSIMYHMLKYHGNYRKGDDSDFRVLIINFDYNYERVITEALLIKFMKPSLNVHSDSFNHIKCCLST